MTGDNTPNARTQNSRHTQIISQHTKCTMCMLGAKVNSKIIIIIESNEEEEKEFWMRRYKENKKETTKVRRK